MDEAIYLLGHCYLRSKDYPNAQVEFERLLRDYPESDSSGSAAYRLGEALRGQSRPADFDQDFTMLNGAVLAVRSRTLDLIRLQDRE